MAVQVWIGEKPEHPNERRAIVALANGLDRLDGLYVILANFSVGGHSIDLVIIKRRAIFIIELKHCDGKVIGGVNGHWIVESSNGQRKRLNPGRKNPYNQVIAYFYGLTNFLNEHRRDFISAHKAATIDFRTCKRVVVIAPSIHPDSQLDLDWKVELKGLDELPAYLVTELSSEIDLTEEEMLAIPRLLNCTRWSEVNALLEGVLPHWQSDESMLADLRQRQPAAETPTPTPATPTEQRSARSLSLLERFRAALRTTTGRAAAVLGGVALALAILLIVRPTQVVIPAPDQPAMVNTSAAPSNGMFLSASTTGDTCVWSGFQPIGKHWDERSQDWINVAVDGATADSGPDVVVTLEQVVYCNEQAMLTWNVYNYSSQTVELPLHSKNISIHDMLGNEYGIADDESQPAKVRVTPGEQGRGTVVVSRPINRNAQSLVVSLKEQPFGAASWLVSLEN